MNKKLKIGIDLDSTLNNLEVVWLERYNKDYKDSLKEWTTWEVQNHVKPECGKKIFDYLHDPKFFYNLDIRSNAKYVIDFLSKHFELYIVTAYTSDTCVDKVNWIKKQKLEIDEKNIIFINNKKLLDLDYLIDDGPHNIEGFKGKGIVYDMPYNQNIKAYMRVYNWNNIFELFLDELIDQWHNSNTKLELIDYLGVTKELYEQYVCRELQKS